MVHSAMPRNYAENFAYRWKGATHELQKLLRSDVLLPLHPQLKHMGQVWKNVDTAVVLPAWHCAFHGCTSTSEKWEARNNHQSDLWNHIWNPKTHRKELVEIINKFRLTDNFLDLGEVAFTLYNQALLECERDSCPSVGIATDRRVLCHLGEVFYEDNISTLICFICNCKHVRHIGFDKFGKQVSRGTIDYRNQFGDVLHRLFNDTEYDDLWQYNLSWKRFKNRFGVAVASDPGLQENVIEWRRQVVRNGKREEALCCPEDVFPSKYCKHSDEVICSKCFVPICQECWDLVLRKEKIPKALCCDNFIGYAHHFLVQHNVNWLEATIASPVFTGLVTYYVEGHDRDHFNLMDSVVGKAERSWGVRGNIFSFLLPWENILSQLFRKVEDGDLSEWPLSPETMLHIVRVRFIRGPKDLLQQFRDLRIRSKIVKKLAAIYIDRKVQDLKNRPGVLKIHAYQKCASIAESLKRHAEARIDTLYPTPKHESAEGDVLPGLDKVVDAQGEEQTFNNIDSPFDSKQSTMHDNARSAEKLFQHVRPSLVCDERESAETFAPEVVANQAMDNVLDMTIKMSNVFEDQWISQYLPRIFPWTLNYDCGGAEYPGLFAEWDESAEKQNALLSEGIKQRWRKLADEATLTPGEYAKMLASRSEMQIAGDWMTVPGARNLHWRYTVLHSAFVVCKQKVAPGETLNANLDILIEATKKIWQRISSNTVVINGHKKNINGNIGMLFSADNISQAEKIILRSYLNTTASISGCQAIRLKIGHCCFGFRVVHGEVIFITASPNRRHSAMILKLSRARRNDTSLDAGDDVARARQKHCGKDSPRMFSQRSIFDDPSGEQTSVEIPLPDIFVRQGWNAQDPLSSCFHYLVFMHVILPNILGLRMCFSCPDCNAEPVEMHDSNHWCTCSDYMGCNHKSMGGFAGFATGCCFATEYQGEATTHGHGFVSLANMYQHHTLEEIGRLIEENHKGISPQEMLQRITRFVEHVQREDHVRDDEHQRQLDSLEKEFGDNNAGPTRNIHLSVRPRQFYSCENAPCMWNSHETTRSAKDEDTNTILKSMWDKAFAEAQSFKNKFDTDVQFVFSHVQHHWHAKDEDGNRVPLKYCRVKGKRGKPICKSGFPKKVLKHKNGSLKQEKYRTRIVCQGVAAELDLKTSGRRNALGSIAGKRRCAYFASTAALLAHVSRSNTNVQCNYRVPIMTSTHDQDCKNAKCITSTSRGHLCLIAQRAMKQMTGYFGGYISKRQKIGSFELKKSVSALTPLKAKLEERNLKTASAQLAHVTNRMFTTLEGKGILRMATEEFMLSFRYKPHDPLSAEFIRTFRHQEFHGKFYLDRYEALSNKKKTVDMNIVLPRTHMNKIVFDEVSLYGFRDCHPNLFFLSPWEFYQWFKPHQLKRPSITYDWSVLTGEGRRKMNLSKGTKVDLEIGIDYMVNMKVVRNCPFLYTYPEGVQLGSPKLNERYEHFRKSWLLIRRQRPVVPCPTNCPMPNKRMSKHTRSKIFSVYLRPWTLVPKLHCAHVPYLGWLHGSKDKSSKTEQHATCNDEELSLRTAWKDYLSTVFPHARRQITNFLLCCIAEGKNYCEDEDDMYRRGSALTCNISHADIIDILSFQKRHEVNTLTGSNDLPSNENEGSRSALKKKINPTATRMSNTASLAMQLAEASALKTKKTSTGHKLTEHFYEKPVCSDEQPSVTESVAATAKANVLKHDWVTAYAHWKQSTYDMKLNDHVVPNAQQTKILDCIHQRCVFEQTGQGQSYTDPLLRLIHGLPGSGKSKLLQWVRTYFVQVWQWTEGREFVFIAPLNSMACGIGGSTVHGWGRIVWQDKRGMRIAPSDKHDTEELSAMTVRCGALRFIFIDEVEATGAETIGQLEHNVRFHVPSKNLFKYDIHKKIRIFGGINVCLIGDLWQLRPTGQVAIMSNPFSTKAMENAKARTIMSMFWDSKISFSLQPWQDKERILHLSVNQRSGADKWFSSVLDECREGALSESNYNFLHGYPTSMPITFWFAKREINNGEHTVPKCQYTPYHILDHWHQWPQQNECYDCWLERKRRARVLFVDTRSAQAQERLTNAQFAKAVLITQYNVAVYYFAQQRALNFAQSQNEPSFWIQSTDAPPAWYANGYSTKDLQELKKKWLSYHARKTQGILSLLLACFNMPYRVTNSHGKEFKEYGIHNGAKCVLKAWKLDEKDAKKLQHKTEASAILTQLPKILFVEMQTPMKKQYPGLPANWFPMQPVSVYWCLDLEENIDICRRGFPLVPDFSTTGTFFFCLAFDINSPLFSRGLI